MVKRISLCGKVKGDSSFSFIKIKKKLNTETQRHGKKDEGGRMMDEKEKTSITVSTPLSRGNGFILHPSSLIPHTF
jgi:hypothetical protein